MCVTCKLLETQNVRMVSVTVYIYLYHCEKHNTEKSKQKCFQVRKISGAALIVYKHVH